MHPAGTDAPATTSCAHSGPAIQPRKPSGRYSDDATSSFGALRQWLLATFISPAAGRPWPRPQPRDGETGQEARRDHAPATRGRPRQPPATRVYTRLAVRLLFKAGPVLISCSLCTLRGRDLRSRALALFSCTTDCYYYLEAPWRPPHSARSAAPCCPPSGLVPTQPAPRHSAHALTLPPGVSLIRRSPLTVRVKRPVALA